MPFADIVFRVDASHTIGTGHVMRCLALADALKGISNRISFISRPLDDGSMVNHIRRRGFHVLDMRIPSRRNLVDPERYADWLEVSLEQEIEESKTLLDSMQPDLLIIDHYALDETWEREMRRTCFRTLVIDDLANRNHACSVLVDQTISRKENDYKNLVNKECVLLVGSEYSLVRPEFISLRNKSIGTRSVQKTPRKWLITMGGVDALDMTSVVMNTLNTCDLPIDSEIRVALRSNARNASRVLSLSRDMRYSTEVQLDSLNMHALMLECDLAICAAGTTVAELCTMGVPMVVIQTAKNQSETAAALAQKSAAIVVDTSDVYGSLKRIIDALLNGNIRLQQLSLNGLRLIDGKGLERVVRQISTMT